MIPSRTYKSAVNTEGGPISLCSVLPPDSLIPRVRLSRIKYSNLTAVPRSWSRTCGPRECHAFKTVIPNT